MLKQPAIDLFGHYKIQQVLATKETSSTFLAGSLEHPQHQVVIKAFNRAYISGNFDYKNSNGSLKNMLSLSHRWIAPLFDVVFNQTHLYFVRAYLADGSLRDRLQDLTASALSGCMPWEEVFIIILKTGQALVHAHNHGIIHANIKPENILYNKGEVMLADFSLTSALHLNTIAAPFNLHATHYMAPEQFMGTVNALSDQYALACVAYELLSGHPPFAASQLTSIWNKHANEDPVPLALLAPHVPDSMTQAISKALSKDPYERYPDMATFLLELEHGHDLLSMHTAITQKLDPVSYAVEINTSLSQQSKTARVQNQSSIHTGSIPARSSSTPGFSQPDIVLPAPEDDAMTMLVAGETDNLTQAIPSIARGTTMYNNPHRTSHNPLSLSSAYTAPSPPEHKRLHQPLLWITLLLIIAVLVISLGFFLFPEQRQSSETHAHPIRLALTATTVTTATSSTQSTHVPQQPTGSSQPSVQQSPQSSQPSHSTPTSSATPMPSPHNHRPTPTTIVQQTPVPSLQDGVTMRINAGGDSVGNFVADTDYTDPTGSPCDGTDHIITTHTISNPAPQAVYQNNRCAPYFAYTLPGLKPASHYTIRLHFAETYWTQAGQRIFSVSINGQIVLAHFDIIASTGGRFRAIVEQFTTMSTNNGQITITFSAIRDNALLSGLEVISDS